MANYFNSLPLRLQLEQLGVCEFMDQSEFANGITEYEYDHVLLADYCGDIRPNPEEIEELRWVDFGELKKDLRNIADSMDHALIIERNSLKETTFEALKSENFKIIELDFRPTAENMAKYFYEKIKILGYNMRAVTVYETPANSATYME